MGGIGKFRSGYALKNTKTVQPERRVFGYTQGSRAMPPWAWRYEIGLFALSNAKPPSKTLESEASK